MSTDEGAHIRRADKQARLERFIADGDHRNLLLRGDAGVGKSTLIQRVSVTAAAQGWRVLLSTAVEAEASVIGRGERLQTRAGEGAQRATDEDCGQFAAVVTEHDRKYGGN